MKLAKAMASLGGLTLVSRITGLFRDRIAAGFLGSGELMDAFVIAFRLPNLFRALFAEGAFNSVFVPLFSRRLEREGQKSANQLSGNILTFFIFLLLILTIIIEIFMPKVITFIAGGQAINKEITIYLARVMFPYMVIVALASAGAAIMNSLSKFIAAALLPIILNLGMVCTLLFFYPFFATKAHAYAFGVIFSGIVQLLWIGFICYKNQAFPKIGQPRMDNDIKQFFIRLLPGLTAAGVYQINAVLATRLASDITGANSWLYYADRLYQLPLGIIGIAASTALLPMISRKFEAKDNKGAIQIQNKALEITLILAFPCMFGLMITGSNAIRILFQYGQFSAFDTLNVAKAVSAYSLGLPAAMIIRTLSAGFFGRGNTKTPFFAALFAVFLFITINFSFIATGRQGHVYIALSSSISIWGQAILLWFLLKKNKLWQPSQTLFISIITSFILASLMGLLLYLMKKYLFIENNGLLYDSIAFSSMVLSGFVFWLIGAYFLGLIKQIRI